MKKNTTVIAVSIVIGCLFIGGIIYLTQMNKQQSLELQYEKEQALEEEKEQLKADEDVLSKKEEECESLTDSLKARWSNVISVYYNESYDACYVKYFDELGNILDSNIDYMGDKEKQTIELDYMNYTHYSEPVKFRGSVSGYAEKIGVVAQGNGYYDDYTLTKFNPGNKTFEYQAKKEYGNLADGINTYTFTAYYYDGTTDTDIVTIYFSPSYSY